MREVYDMKNIKKKIIKRIMGLFLAISAAVAAVYFGGTKALENAVFTSVVKQPYEPPIIVLDAGHGECY